MVLYKLEYISADASVGKANNINSGLYQHMHAFQIQLTATVTTYPGTPQCKSLQLQASRVTIATATVQPVTCLCTQGL